MAYHSSRALTAIATERHIVGHPDGRDRWLMAKFVHQPFGKRKTCRGCGIFLTDEGDLPGQNMIRAESRRHGHRTFQAEPEQARSDQQGKGQCDLGDDESVTQFLSGAAARSRSTFGLKHIAERASKTEPGDGRRHRHSRDDGCCQGGQCQSGIECNKTPQRQAIGAQHAQQSNSAGSSGQPK